MAGFDLRLERAPARWPDDYVPELESAPELLRVPAARRGELEAALGPALDREARPPSPPAWPPAWLDDERATELMDAWALLSRGYPCPVAPPSAAEREAVERHQRELARRRDLPSPREGTLAAYKLGPGGFLLDEQDCAVLERALAGRADPFLARVRAFAAVARASGGMRAR